jgi:glycosyltransferase involved in cell wall biosynthesis
VFTAHDMNSICPASAMLYDGKICEDCINNGYKACIKKSCIKNSKLKSIIGVLEKKYYDLKKIYNKIDCIISPSEFIKNQLIKGNLKYKNIEVIHNFVMDSNINGTYEDEGYAFFFGRLSVEKGILNLVKAMKNLEGEKLFIAGNGPEKENIENYINENNLNDRIKLLGYLKQEEIKKYIQKAKFIVIPSIWYENCPYSILEAMEIGKPLIGSKIGGIPELIKNEQNGFLYEFDNIEELTIQMKKLFDDKELVHKQAMESRELFEKKYSENIYYNKIMNVYERVIGVK